MYKWTVLYIFFFGLFLQALATIVIKELSGTESAQLGTNTTTIKCDYDFQNETGVEVKWFYNDSVQIFTWVPNLNKPQPMGPFSSNLDVNNNSIRFKEMTRNLTGYYTCKVSSNDNEEFKTEIMIVYQPPKKVEFFPEDTSETVICSAYELYPVPTITIFGSQNSGSNKTVILTGEDERLYPTEDALYNVTKTFKFDSKAIEGSAEFICNVYIPDTSFNHTETFIYYTSTGDESTTTENPDEFTTIPTETSITISTSSNSTNNSDNGVPTAEVSKWFMLVLLLILISSKQ